MIYISCFLLSTAFAWLASRSKERLAIFLWSALSILVLCVLGGLRNPFVYADVRLYAWPDFFTSQRSENFAELLAMHPERELEIGYFFVCYLSSKIFGHINWTLFFYQLITVTCVYIGAYKHKDNISFPLLWLAFCLMPYCTSYNVMRQHMAAAIIFMGLPCLEEKKYLKFSLYILVARMFHNSAVIAFPLLLGVHVVMTSHIVNKSSLIKFFVICGGVMFMLSIKSLIVIVLMNAENFDRYSNYLTSRYAATDIVSSGLSHIIIYTVELLVLTIYRKRAEKIIKPSKGGVAFFQTTLIIDTTYYMFIRFLSGRILMYSEYMNLILLAALPSFVKEKHLKILAYGGVMTFLVLYWMNVYIRAGQHQVWPYRSIQILY